MRGPEDRLHSRERDRLERWREAGAIVAAVAVVGDVRRVLEDEAVL